MRQSPTTTETQITSSGFVPCQLLSFAAQVPVGPDWSYERKYDGYRFQAQIRRGRIKLFTRSGGDWTARLPYLVDQLTRLPVETATLDGELCWMGADGSTKLGDLAQRIQRQCTDATYVAFDILELDNNSLMDEPLEARRRALKQMLSQQPGMSPIQLSPVSSDGLELFRQMQAKGYEGIVAKRAGSLYQPDSRNNDWVKIKCRQSGRFIVPGVMVDPERRIVTSLVLAHPDAQLTYAGRVGSGLSNQQRSELFAAQQPRLGVAPSSVRGMPDAVRRNVQWIDAPMICEVGYLEISSKGIIREPSIVRLAHSAEVSNPILSASFAA